MSSSSILSIRSVQTLPLSSICDAPPKNTNVPYFSFLILVNTIVASLYSLESPTAATIRSSADCFCHPLDCGSNCDGDCAVADCCCIA